MLKTPGFVKKYTFPLHRMIWLRLHLSNLCNFACPGCHVFKISPNEIPATNMPYEVAEKAILFFTELMKKYYPGEKWLYLSIYGGEPLLNRPVLYKLLEKFGNEHNGVNFNWVVNTNGSLLNQEDLKRFLPNEVDIHMSVDGREEKHNRSRRDKQDQDTFERVMQGIELVGKTGYPYLQFDSVANPFEIDSINEIIDVAREKDVARVHLDFFYSLDYPRDFSAEKYGQAYANAYLFGKSKGVQVSESIFSNVYWNYFRGNDITTGPISAMFPSMHFYADGNFSFNELPLTKPFGRLADLADGIEAVWQQRISRLMEMEKELSNKCRDCYLFKYCRGSTRKIYRYHTLTDKFEDNICAATRIAVMELAKNNYNPY
jgi:radical SAM protein with 4Fe4S-binding SPASM domain